MTATMNRNAMMSYSASANNAEAAFACDNNTASVIIMSAAFAALFFVILSVIVGVLMSIVIGLALIIPNLIIVNVEKSPKSLKQRA